MLHDSVLYKFTIGKTTVSALHDAQLLLNKQQQISRGVYIHWHISSSTDTAVLPLRTIYIKRQLTLTFSERSAIGVMHEYL